MTPSLTSSPPIRTLEDLLDYLAVPPARVRYFPLPGTATLEDVIENNHHDQLLCELIDGVLVEKGVGFWESIIAAAIGAAIRAFAGPKKLGYVGGESGMVQLSPGQVRGSDVSFTLRSRLAIDIDVAYPLISPDMVVEVLSPSNTTREMERKRREYFSSGVRLVWMVDIVDRTVTVYTSPEHSRLLTAGDTLDGGDVLPEFTLELGPLFAELDQ